MVPRSEVRIMFLKTLLYTTTKSEVRIIFLKTLLYTTTNWKTTQIIRSSMEPYSTHFRILYQRRGLDTWMNAWSYYLIKTKYQIIKQNQCENKMEAYSNTSNFHIKNQRDKNKSQIKILKVHNSPIQFLNSKFFNLSSDEIN